jgi:hypothetical protein
MMRRASWLWILCALFLSAAPACAGEPRTAHETLPEEGVRAWLELQRSGAAAAPPKRMPSEAAIRIYREYLKSFEHALPESFGSYGGRGDARP